MVLLSPFPLLRPHPWEHLGLGRKRAPPPPFAHRLTSQVLRHPGGREHDLQLVASSGGCGGSASAGGSVCSSSAPLHVNGSRRPARWRGVAVGSSQRFRTAPLLLQWRPFVFALSPHDPVRQTHLPAPTRFRPPCTTAAGICLIRLFLLATLEYRLLWTFLHNVLKSSSWVVAPIRHLSHFLCFLTHAWRCAFLLAAFARSSLLPLAVSANFASTPWCPGLPVLLLLPARRARLE